MATGVLFTGAKKIENGWPFACYPSFANSGPAVLAEYAFPFVLPSRETLDFVPAKSFRTMARLNGVRANRLVNSAVWAFSQNPEKLGALLSVLVRHHPRITTATHLKVYKVPFTKSVIQREIAQDKKVLVLETVLPIAAK